MGKRSSKEISRIGESGSSAWQQRCQEAIDSLNKGEIERVVEFLNLAGTENLRADLSFVIGVARQICLAYLRSKADLTRYRQAQQEADQSLREFQEQLSIILNQISQPESYQNLPLPEKILSSHRIPISSRKTQPPGSQKQRGLWQHIRSLFSAISPSLGEEKDIPAVEIQDTPTQGTDLFIPEVEEPASLLTESLVKLELGPLSLIVYYLGPFRVYQGDKEITEWHGFKGRDILKYLLARRETPVAKYILMDVFWPDADPKAARRNLHQSIYSLRQTLRGEQPEFHHIWFENDSYFVNPQMEVWLDYREFEKCALAGRRLEDAGRLEEAIKQYETAEKLYQGDFLQEDLYEDWPTLQRENLLNQYLSVADRLSEIYLRNRQYAAVIPICKKVVAKDRTNETAHRHLMQCYLAQGLRHLAVRQYQICVRALKEDLGIAPTEETVALYERIVSQG